MIKLNFVSIVNKQKKRAADLEDMTVYEFGQVYHGPTNPVNH